MTEHVHHLQSTVAVLSDGYAFGWCSFLAFCNEYASINGYHAHHCLFNQHYVEKTS